MSKVLALTKDGKITYCVAPESQRNRGRCNHISHQMNGENAQDFINRISYLKDQNSHEAMAIKRQERKLEITNDDALGEFILGNQIKYFKNNSYIKIDGDGINSGLSEEISSILLNFSNLENAKYQTYAFFKQMDGDASGKIEDTGLNCVSSPNFLKDGEQLFSFHEILSCKQLRSLESQTDILNQFDTLVDSIMQNTGVDCRSYLLKTIALDLIICNPDRHLNNISLIKGRNHEWKLAPCYDNGLALLSNCKMFPLDGNFGTDDGVDCNAIPLATFHSNNQDDYIDLIQRRAKVEDDVLQLDLDNLKYAIESYSNFLYKKECVERAKSIIMSRLNELENVVWIKRI